MKILLGVTGSVAAKLTQKLITQLLSRGCEVRVITTESSLYFWMLQDVRVSVYRDVDEWKNGHYSKYSPVLHIDLRDWADILLIAPLSANTLAKLSNGLADNLLTCVARAWKTDNSMILAPAMNTHMWTHPATKEQLKKLKSWNSKLVVIPPISKMLACGTEGVGAMAEIDNIVEVVIQSN